MCECDEGKLYEFVSCFLLLYTVLVRNIKIFVLLIFCIIDIYIIC